MSDGAVRVNEVAHHEFEGHESHSQARTFLRHHEPRMQAIDIESQLVHNRKKAAQRTAT